MAAANSFSLCGSVSSSSTVLGLNSLSSTIAANMRINRAAKRIVIPSTVMYTPCIVAI